MSTCNRLEEVCVSAISVLQLCTRQVLVTLTDFVLGGALRASCLNFWGENPRFDLKWLYLTMVAFKSFPC
jgi:hypothetical protein